MYLNPSHYLKVTNNRIYNSKVNHDLKITTLSDLHISQEVKEETTDFLKYQVAKERPDYICLLGDLVDSPKDLEREKSRNQLTNLLKSLSGLSPVCLILGSHDYVIDEVTKKVYDYKEEYWSEVNKLPDVHLLNNEIYQDKTIFIMGYFLSMPYYYNLEKYAKEDVEYFYQELLTFPQLYQNIPENIPTLALVHSPDIVKYSPNVKLLSDYDVIASGHYHEGCMPAILDDLPGVRGIVGPRKAWLPKRARGLTVLETNSILIINGGIIKIQECASNMLKPLNNLCYQHMDNIIFTPDETCNPYELTRKRVYTKKKY